MQKKDPTPKDEMPPEMKAYRSRIPKLTMGRGLFRGIRLLWMMVFFLGMTSLVFWFLDTRTDYVLFQSDRAGISMEYDQSLRKDNLSEQDKQEKIVLRLQQASGDPEMLVTVRYEEGLKKAASAAKQNLREMLQSNITRAYPVRFPEYSEVSSRNFEVDGRSASEVIFTYKSQAGDIIKQRFMLVVRDDDSAVYVSAQAKNENFEDINSRHFDNIFDTLHLY